MRDARSLNLLAGSKGWQVAGVLLFSLISGVVINRYFVPGNYEWLGLFRIFGELVARDGFWCLALLLWGAGVAGAGNGNVWLSRISWPRRLMVFGGGFVLVFGLANAGNAIVFIGSFPDFLAFCALLSGMLMQAFFQNGSVASAAGMLLRCLLWGAGIMFCYTIVSYFHTMVKGTIFVFASASDQLLWRMDSFLAGADYYRQLQGWRLAHPGVVAWLDVVYIGLMQQMGWSAFYFYGSQDAQQGRRYVGAMLLIYVLGPFLYFFSPSYGPLFHRPDLFGDLLLHAPDTWGLSRYLALMTDAAISGTAMEIAPYCYVAAMPSLHVGIAVIMLLAMRHTRLALWFNSVFLALTAVATNVLGWHYWADVIVGAVLGVFCWWLVSFRKEAGECA